MAKFTPMENPSAFKKLAASLWHRSRSPLIHGSIDIDYTACDQFTKWYNTRFDTRITPTHLTGRAIALIMKRHPEINAVVGLTRFLMRDSADVTFAVSTESGHDLSASKIEAADGLSLRELEDRLRQDADRIRAHRDKVFESTRMTAKRLPLPLSRPIFKTLDFLVTTLNIDLSRFHAPNDPMGGAVVTSVGMFGLEAGYPNLPVVGRCSLIAAVMEVRKRPWVVEDRVEPRPVLRICATFDHRIIDGYMSGLVAKDMEFLLANPVDLLTEEEREIYRQEHKVPETE